MNLLDPGLNLLLAARGADIGEIIAVLVLALVSWIVKAYQERAAAKKQAAKNKPDAAPDAPPSPLEELRLDRRKEPSAQAAPAPPTPPIPPTPTMTLGDYARKLRDSLQGETADETVRPTPQPPPARKATPPPTPRGRERGERPPRPARAALVPERAMASPRPERTGQAIGPLDAAALRRAIILNEILSPPLSLRDER